MRPARDSPASSRPSRCGWRRSSWRQPSARFTASRWTRSPRSHPRAPATTSVARPRAARGSGCWKTTLASTGSTRGPALGLWLDWSRTLPGALRLARQTGGAHGCAAGSRAIVRLRFTLGDRPRRQSRRCRSHRRRGWRVVMDWLRGDRPEGLEEALADPRVARRAAGRRSPRSAEAFAERGARALRQRCGQARQRIPAALTITHMGHAFVHRRVRRPPAARASGAACRRTTDQEASPDHVRASWVRWTRSASRITISITCCPPRSCKLPHGMPVFVPAAGGRPAHAARRPDFLRLMGFRDVRELGTGVHARDRKRSRRCRRCRSRAKGAASRVRRLRCTSCRRRPDARSFTPTRRPATTVNRCSRPARSRRWSNATDRSTRVFGTWWQDRRFLIGLVADRSACRTHVESSDWLRDGRVL